MNSHWEIAVPKLHEGQKMLLELSQKKRFIVAACGRRFGKTTVAGWWLSGFDHESALGGGFPVAWCAPTYKLMLDVYEMMLRAYAPIISRASRTDGRITFHNGGLIDFWTLEDADAGRGRRYKRIVIDEAAMAPRLQQAWEQALAPTLTDYRGSAWFISTPKGTNYFHKLWRRAQSDPLWGALQLPSSVNPRLSQEELEQARAQLPHLVYLQEYEAQFVTMGAGLVSSEMLVVGECPPDLPVYIGVDLAISQDQRADYTAIAIISVDQTTGIVYIRDVVRGRWPFAETLYKIDSIARRWKPAMIAVEQVAYQAAVVQELLRGSNLPVRGIRPERDKVTRFGPLLTRFERKMVRISSDAPQWLHDELLAFPEGEHDDAVDALSLAFSQASNPPVYRYESLGSRVWASRHDSARAFV